MTSRSMGSVGLVATAAMVLSGSYRTTGMKVVGVAQPPFGSTWLSSFEPAVNLSVNGPVLRWTEPQHFSALFSYLEAPLPLVSPGQKVNLTMRWRSDGDETCPAECFVPKDQYCQLPHCQKLKCASKSVRCLAGTGDFRIALLDTTHAGSRLTKPNWCPAGIGYGNATKCVEAEPFASMRGYDFRIFPHLSTAAKHEPGQVPCSIYRKSSANLFGKSPRLGEWGCFGTPVGEWTSLTLTLARRRPGVVTASMEMNGIRYEADDIISSSDPTNIVRIDAVAIGYPNGRHYSYVELAATAIS